VSHDGTKGVTWPALAPIDQDRVRRFRDACARLDEGLIRPEQSGLTPVRSTEHWDARMAEMASFLAACGDPQRSFEAVHVTGTSGKGSVSTMIARALHLAGYRVGLHTSPFLQVQTEKHWIAGDLVSADEFADLVDWVWPVAIPRRTPENPASIHGMASVAIAFESFRRAEVEVAVVEAGCGGRFDLTSFVDPLVTVVTSVGIDHVQSLGPTVDDIAWHKAGILRRGVPAVTGATGSPLEVLRREARALDAPLAEVEPPSGEPFWKVNAAVARAALHELRHRFPVPDDVIEQALSAARLPARHEVVPEPGRRVVLDGAHNADKMAAFLRTVEPGAVFVLGCLTAKDASVLVETVARMASAVVATEPHVHAKPATPASVLGAACARLGVEAHVEPDPRRAVELALDVAGPDRLVAVTGSLYLIGEVRDRWYPWQHVLLQRTSWPRP
jgi:dihydrofolate synthase/folylpolyglutamate synthase